MGGTWMRFRTVFFLLLVLLYFFFFRFVYNINILLLFYVHGEYLYYTLIRDASVCNIRSLTSGDTIVVWDGARAAVNLDGISL